MSHVTGRGLATLPAPRQCSEDLKAAQEIYDGEPAELEALYKKLAPDLVRFLRRRLLQHSYSLADDIAQDAFLIMVRKWTEVRDHPNPRAWLYKVARNLMLDALKKHSREQLQAELPDEAGSEWNDPSDSYDTHLAVHEAIGKLPPRQREAVWLFYFEGFTQREVATIMQIQRDTVAALLHQARYRLVELLEQVA